MEKHARWALGTMSGTSLDGVDAAMLLTDGVDVLEFGPTRYRAYSKVEQKVLRAGLGLWQGPEVEAAAEVVELAHAEVLSKFDAVDVIGFHGQTLVHDPSEGRTLQVGNGALLADALSIPVVWDFRTADINLGGQGAPLAPFYHFALAKRAKVTRPVGVLNLGGVGNLTWMDPSKPSPDTSQAILAFDTGPANAVLNDLMSARLGKAYDENGELGAAGAVDESALEVMLSNPYFSQSPPKSLDRNDFADWLTAVQALSDADAAATLTAATAATVVTALDHCPKPPAGLWVTGGGRLNPTMMAMIDGLAPCPVRPVEDAGFDGDMMEAQAFGHLAVRVLDGRPTSAPGTTGVPTPVGGGIVSHP